jgi:hypothetical protein
MISTASPSSAEPRFIAIDAPGASESTFHTKNIAVSSYEGGYTSLASATAQSLHTFSAEKPLRKSTRGRVGGSVSCAARTSAMFVSRPPSLGEEEIVATVPFTPPYLAFPGCAITRFCVEKPRPCG